MHLDDKDVPQMISTKSLVQTPTLLTLQGSEHPTTKPAPTASSPSTVVGCQGVEHNISEYVAVTSFKTPLVFPSLLQTTSKEYTSMQELCVGCWVV